MNPKRKTRLRRLSNALSFAVLIGLVSFVLLWDLMVKTTPVGHTSVVWHRLSWTSANTSDGPLAEGAHLILPWDKFYTYDIRLQTFDQSYEVVSLDGLHMEITLTFRWRAVKNNIVELNDNVGPNYLETLLIPVVGSVAREVISGFKAEDLYSFERVTVQNEIYKRVVSHDYPDGIDERQTQDITQDLVVLEDTLIKNVRLPQSLQDAIEQKLEQAQRVEEYKFRVETEKLESARKQIEGQGIREFQETVAPAISESYLRWRGIEATLKLAESNNAKVVVIGNSETGLPLILDTSTTALEPQKLSEATPAIPSGPEPKEPRSITTGDGERVLFDEETAGEGTPITNGDVENVLEYPSRSGVGPVTWPPSRVPLSFGEN
ncbi:MAG: prohibitin family protein [Sulfitobacter sp.]